MSKHSILLLTAAMLLGLLAQPWSAAGDEATAPGYRLRPGDTLEVTVSGEPSYSGPFLLDSTGTIIFADGSAGTITVAGLSPAEAQDRIQQKLAEYLRDPVVAVRVSKFRVLVSGEVQNPGSYEINAGETVMDAITRAGGAKREVALAVVELRRASGETLLLEPRTFLETGEESQNRLLQPGDEILVGPSGRGDEYKVTGAVKLPGVYPLPRTQPVRVVDAIEAAGRWAEDADPRRAMLIKHDGTQLTVDLAALSSQPGNPGNTLLEAGDEIFVPRKTVQITVQGGVNQPGEYMVEEGTTFMQALGKAGGPKNTAILKQCVLVHSKPQNSWTQVDLEKFLKKGDMGANPMVQDGDILWVAEREGPKQGQSFFDIMRNTVGPLIWLFGL